VRFCDLTFFASRGGLGNGGSFGTAGSFDTLSGGGASGLFGLAQSTAHGGVSVFCLVRTGGLGCMARGGLRCCGCGFGFGLGNQRLLANLFCGAMP
jgi:hypothetical protein